MKPIFTMALLGPALLGLTATAVHADDKDKKQPSYGAALFSYEIPDSVRQDTWGLGAQLLYGIPLSDKLSVELNGFGIALSEAHKNGNPAGDSSSDARFGAGADLRYLFTNSSRFTPFVLGGLGADWESYHYSKNEFHWGPYADVGVGVLARLTSHLSARLEARYYGTYNSESYTPHALGDTRINLGFQYAFFHDAPPPPPPAPPVCPPPPKPVAKQKPKCPPAPAGFKVDANGCLVDQTVVLRGVNFQFNRHVLTPAAETTLQRIADLLEAQPGLHVEIDGYTDSVGSAEYNLKLSQHRAESVRQYLIDRGVKPSQLSAKGFGEADPVASNRTKEGRASNRRVQFQVLNAPEQVKVINKAPTEASQSEAQHGEPKSLPAKKP